MADTKNTRIFSFPILLLVGIALAGAASLVMLLYNLQLELTEQRRIFREDSVWSASQIEREARVFRENLYRFAEGGVTHSELSSRFDVLWSRIENMDGGALGDIYLQLEGAENALRSGREMLRAVDPLVRRMVPGDTADRDLILHHLDPVIENLFSVARHASAFALSHQEQRRYSFERTSRVTLLLVCVVFLSGSLLFWMLLSNQRRLDQLAENLEQKVLERTMELEESNQSLQMMSQAIEQSPVSVMICNREGNIEYVNPKFVEVTGYSFEEAIGRNPRFIQSGKTPEATYREMWQSVHADRVWRGEMCNRKKNGEYYWEHISFSPIRDGSRRIAGYLAVKEDISHRKEYEKQLLHQANYDSLTGLPNRMLAMDRLKQAILRVRRNGGVVALLFVDLDNFKEINDTFGHDCGDAVLKKAAERFALCLRDCDTAARFGGDEFLVILSELQDREDVLPILDRIVEVFHESFLIENRAYRLSASIGVSVCPDDSWDAAQLLKNSDSAMYASKRTGKDNYTFFGIDAG